MKRIIVFLWLLLVSQSISSQTIIVPFDDLIVAIAKPTVVATSGFSSVTNTTAVLELALESGESGTLVGFQVDTSDELVCQDPGTLPNSSAIDEGDSFRVSQSGLIADTDYFYRACAIDSRGNIVSGEINQFRTSNTVAIRTLSAIDVAMTEATLRGELVSGRGIESWFAFAQTSAGIPSCRSTQDPDVQTFSLSAGETFNETRTSLTPNVEYRYRACARRNDGRFFNGILRSFVTGDANTEVLTLPASSIEVGSVVLNGEVVSGTNVVTSFVLGDNDGVECPSNDGLAPLFTNRNTGDVVSSTFTSLNEVPPRPDLQASTEYYYRFCARNTNTNQFAQGELASFTTDADGSALNFVSIDNISTEGATFTGQLISAAQPKLTWFIQFLGNVGSIDSSDCANAPRLSEVILDNVTDQNVFNQTGLDSNTEYTVAFCGEGLVEGTGEISVGDVQEFTTSGT